MRLMRLGQRERRASISAITTAMARQPTPRYSSQVRVADGGVAIAVIGTKVFVCTLTAFGAAEVTGIMMAAGFGAAGAGAGSMTTGAGNDIGAGLITGATGGGTGIEAGGKVATTSVGALSGGGRSLTSATCTAAATNLIWLVFSGSRPMIMDFTGAAATSSGLATTFVFWGSTGNGGNSIGHGAAEMFCPRNLP